MKKAFNFIKGILLFAVIFFALSLLGAIIFPVGDDGVVQIPGWYFTGSLLFSVVAPFIIVGKIISKISDALSKNDPVKIYALPKREHERIQRMTMLHIDSKNYYNSALASKSVSGFIADWDSSNAALQEIIKYQGTVKDNSTILAARKDLYEHERIFQWKFRDAIEREAARVLSDIAGEHRNNKTGRCNDFAIPLYSNIGRMDGETKSFAENMLQRVADGTGVDFVFNGKTIGRQAKSVQEVSTPSTMERIDAMDGHDFEQWCAGFLTDIGYKRVSVTRGSGDQGIDVLAEKDGITYAIQCKCYSHDLDNTPVQEASAGKVHYQRQIAVVMTNRYFTAGAKELAKSNGVLLWDRDWIQNAIQSRI